MCSGESSQQTRHDGRAGECAHGPDVTIVSPFHVFVLVVQPPHHMEVPPQAQHESCGHDGHQALFSDEWPSMAGLNLLLWSRGDCASGLSASPAPHAPHGRGEPIDEKFQDVS